MSYPLSAAMPPYIKGIIQKEISTCEERLSLWQKELDKIDVNRSQVQDRYTEIKERIGELTAFLENMSKFYESNT